MMSIRYWCVFVLCDLLFNIQAQEKLTRQKFIADSVKISSPKLIRPQFRVDDRLFFLNGQKFNITGVDAGILLKNKLRVTLGYYSLSDKLISLKKKVDSIEYQGRCDLHYGALNTEFIYKNTRFFSLGMPLEFGFGGNTLSYHSGVDALQPDKHSGFVSIVYFGLSGTFKPIRWVGLRGAVGYRKTLYNKIKDLSSDGIFTSIGLSVDFREIIMDCKMYKLKKRYQKNFNSIGTAVDLITD